MEPLLVNHDEPALEDDVHDIIADNSNRKKLLPESSEQDENQENISINVKKSKFTNLAWFNGWWIEITSFILLLGLLAAVNILLHHYDKKTVESTPKRPSLSTIINILSTALAALVSLIAASSNRCSTFCLL
jgi:hypothetical protein